MSILGIIYIVTLIGFTIFEGCTLCKAYKNNDVPTMILSAVLLLLIWS